MSPLMVSIIAIVAFLMLAALGLPIAFAFATVGFAGIILLQGPGPALFTLGSAPYQWASAKALIPMPLFVLMGHFVFYSGISSDLYRAAYKWVGRLPGGIAMATTLACTGFAACSGSTAAGAATMGTMAFPEMEKLKYDRRLSTGCIAGGGTLAILIPPSAAFIMYGFLTETSISELFIAGVLPGFLLSGMFLATIFVMCQRNPRLGPPGQSFPLRAMFASLKGIWGVLILFLMVVGGLYTGIFTPSEAGAAGAFGAFVLGLASRRLTIPKLVAALKDSVRISCFVLTIVIGAMIFNIFLVVSGFSTMFAGWVDAIPLSPHAILICILLIYVPLGMFMDNLAITMLTIPIIFPVIINLGFDPIWFGVLYTITGEMALITPPVGMNAYVVQGVTRVPIEDIFRGIIPFFFAMVGCLILLVAFPQISLFLPSMMK
jgi:tripartite ATP-independent transporter DctM subunit